MKKCVQVYNTVFFHEQNMILVSRGLKKIWLGITQGGVVVKIKGFDNYWYDPTNGQVFTKKNRTFSPLKMHYEKKDGNYYFLFKNGIRSKVTHWQILLQNKDAIEIFCLEKNNFRTN